MSLLRQMVLILISKSSKSPQQMRYFNLRSEPSRLMHTKSTTPNNVVEAICDSFRSGWNWDCLSREFHHVQVDEQVVEKILLELKQPIDAKRALGFFHWATHRENFQHGLRSYCLAIHISVRAQLHLDARALIETVLKKNAGETSKFMVVDALLTSYKIANSNPFVFDLLVQAYSRLRMFESGFDVCCYLEEHGFTVSLASFNTLLHVVQKSADNTMVWRIYEHMIRRRIYPDQATVRTLISSLCKEGKLQKYVEILDTIHGSRCSPSVIVNFSLVFRILEEGRVEQGVVLLKRMLQKNMVFDTIAYSLIVYAKLKLENLGSVRYLYDEMLKRGFRANPFVYTLFVGAYCKEGRINEAHCMMKDMEDMGLKPYEETYNSLVEGYAKAGRWGESLRNCEIMMEKGFIPSCAAFNEMVDTLCENGEAEKANAMLTQLLEKGFLPDDKTYASLMEGYKKKGNIEEVLKLFYEMESKSLSPGSSVFSTLIKGLCQSRKLEEVEKYFRIMKSRSLAVTECLYESLISCYIENGDTKQALRLQNELVLEGSRPKSNVGMDDIR